VENCTSRPPTENRKIAKSAIFLVEFKEVYCNNCKRVLGRYNTKYFSDAKIAELIKSSHTSHYRGGHQITVRKTER
jgi:hypothetical protein